MRGGLWSSFSVPAAGIFIRSDPYCDAGTEPRGAYRRGDRGVNAATKESRLELLIWRQRGNVDDRVSPIGTVIAISSSARHRTRNQTAIMAPVEAQPRTPLPRLVLHMSGGVEYLVVIDSKHSVAALSGRRGTDSAHLRLEESGCNTREYDKCRQAM